MYNPTGPEATVLEIKKCTRAGVCARAWGQRRNGKLAHFLQRQPNIGIFTAAVFVDASKRSKNLTYILVFLPPDPWLACEIYAFASSAPSRPPGTHISAQPVFCPPWHVPELEILGMPCHTGEETQGRTGGIRNSKCIQCHAYRLTEDQKGPSELVCIL